MSIDENDFFQFKANVHHWLVFEVGYPLNINFEPALIKSWLDINCLAREWKSWDDLNCGSSEELEVYAEMLTEECGLADVGSLSLPIGRGRPVPWTW